LYACHGGVLTRTPSFPRSHPPRAPSAVPHGNAGTAAVQLSTSSGASSRGTTIGGGYWYVAFASAPNTVGRLALPLPTTTAGAGSYTLASIALPGALSGGFTSLMSVVSESATTIYVTGTSSGSIHKQVFDAGAATWSSAAGYPKTTLAFTPPGGGGAVSVTAFRGASGLTDPSTGAFTLFGATGSASGNNYVIAFRTDTEAVRALAVAGANYDFRAVMAPPQPVTPTPTVTPSASPGSDPSSSPTPSWTASASPTLTPALCGLAQGAGVPNAPVAPGSLIALRVGSGAAALPTGVGMREAFLEEINVDTGARMQTWALPLVAGGSPVGCAIGTSFSTDGFIGRAADGGAVLVPCWNAPVNNSAALSGAVTKVAARLAPGGGLDVAATWTDSSTNYRSITALTASANGSTLYAVGSQGVKGVAVGSFGGASTAVTTSTGTSTRGSTAFGGRVWGAVNGAGVGVVGNLSATGQAWTYEPGLNASGVSPDAGTVAFEDDATVWVLDYVATGNTTLWRHERDAATGVWALSPGYPTGAATWTWGGVTYTQTGGRGLAGYRDPASGAFSLFYTSHPVATGFTTGNFILRFTPSTGATVAVAQSCAQTEFRSVAWAPVVP
jgi:hypothetical protein